MRCSAAKASARCCCEECLCRVVGVGNHVDESELRDADKPRIDHGELPAVVPQQLTIHDQTEHRRELRDENDW